MSAKIAIIGAGASGLTLARLLEINKIDYVVFEQNAASFKLTPQAPVDMLPDAGEHVIRETGLFDKFDKLVRREPQNSVSFDHRGDAISRTTDVLHAQIDRPDLRFLLAESVPKQKIHWESQLQTVTRSSDGIATLHFADGKSESGFKLVVGADGLYSRIRPLVTSATPKYFGVTYIDTSVSLEAPGFWTTIGGRLKPDNLICFGHGKILSAYKQIPGTYAVALGLQVPENWEDPDMSNREVFRDKLLSNEYNHWGTRMVNWLKYSDGEFHKRPLYYMPTEALCWTTVPGLTLIGDAAHACTPFEGGGTGCSMLDSLQLTQKIVQHGMDKLDQAVAEYEKLMFPRAIEMISRSTEIGTVFFARDAPEQFEAMMLGGLEESTSDGDPIQG